jgi:dihydrofolate reductase
MTNVTAALSTSLDGYIAGPEDRVGQPLGVGGERLFDWFSDGDTPSRFYETFRMSAPSAAFFDEFAARGGAVITGRRTYDIARAWGGRGPLPGVPLFVMTHESPAQVPRGEPGDPPYTFVSDGIEAAVELARAVAGEKDVSLMGASTLQQALRAGCWTSWSCTWCRSCSAAACGCWAAASPRARGWRSSGCWTRPG